MIRGVVGYNQVIQVYQANQGSDSSKEADS